MIRKVARNVAAAVCLVVGIAGLFLPFIQGIAMIVLAVVLADFPAKERLLHRYRHTRFGRMLWERHQARLRRDAARSGAAATAAAAAAASGNCLAPESDPPPRPTGEAAGGDDAP